ncbi:MAG: DNA polymerase III subunit gamma/tau [Ruminococcaceae bacterium]|nr:DNA polymerase III subunit gamma/tau [Oscillospiraceae bacterium]
MHRALYRKWRPQTFEDVCGQEHITSILKYETAHHTFSHAYLFCGSRGTGKTTCAKILAKAVNCESPVDGSPCNVCASCRAIDAGTATDVLEMDAASNNGVENIREIRDEVVYTPSALRYRVYIVDEVHMLSGSAFNALLKTLEEPPSHVVFVLATTELHKLPATIVSRCQRFDFRRISTQTLMDRLRYIADEESIEVEDEALRILAKHAQGGMRDAISLLELCAGHRQRITPALVQDTIGSAGTESVCRTVLAIANEDYDALFSIVSEVCASSKDIAVFWQELISYYRDMLVYRTTAEAARYLDLTDSETERLSRSASLFAKETLLHHCRVLDETLNTMQRTGVNKRILAEMALIKLCDSSVDTAIDAMLSRIAKLEAALAAGRVTVTSEREEKIAVVPERKDGTEPAPASPPHTPAKNTQADTVAEVRPAERSAKLIRGWSELAQTVAEGNASVLPFLKMGRAYELSDGSVSLRFGAQFPIDMIERAQLRPALCSALSSRLGRTVGERDIVLEVAEQGADEQTDLDDLALD